VFFVKELISWTKVLIVSILIALLINAFIMQSYRVEGQSMLPSFDERDYTLVFKLNGDFDYEDVVVIDSRLKQDRTLVDKFLENPLLAGFYKGDEHYLWIKRVIGQPGDRLEFKDNRLFRNGELLDESYISEEMRNIADFVVVVPEDHIFVMGDNRNHSTDSRYIGSIPFSHIVGKVVFSLK